MNLDIYIGADLFETLKAMDDNRAPVDLTGATFEGKLRASVDSDDVVATLVVAVVDASAGTFSLALTAATTANLATGTGSWDLWVTVGGKTLPVVVDGRYRIQKRISR